jgi:histidinol-phosphatase (PHP family)
MNYLVDYHHHTNNSFDSNAIMEEVCLRAIDKDIKEICFTEHFSLNPLAPTYGHIDFNKYFREVQACRENFEGKLVIKTGIEICEPHMLNEQYGKVLNPLKLDFILGSIHNINNRKLRSFLNIKDKDAIYRGYFTELLKMVCLADIDALAHLDLMKRYANTEYGSYSFENFKEILVEILEKAIERDIGIEINTSGMRGKLNESLPSIEVLKLYKELGGELLTVGSDSHFSDSVGAYIVEAITIAKHCGFKYIFIYENRNPIAIKI